MMEEVISLQRNTEEEGRILQTGESRGRMERVCEEQLKIYIYIFYKVQMNWKSQPMPNNIFIVILLLFYSLFFMFCS